MSSLHLTPTCTATRRAQFAPLSALPFSFALLAMSRSPVLQQQPTLTFTDQDLTDNYRDTASSSSAASHRSAGSHSTNNRHPRGDTPLSYGGRRGGSGRATGGEWESGSSATSAATRSSDRRIQREGGEDDRSMPSLSRLMAFLDDEDDDEDTRLQHQPPPQTCSPSLSYIHRQQLLRSSTPPVPSPAPHPPHQHDDQHTQTTTQSTVVAASESTASPSLRAHSRSQLRRTDPSLSNPRATLPSATARPTRLDGEGEELPDSPSPLPGSVAGLSWRQAQQGSVLGNGGQGYGGQRAGAGREEEQQEVEEVTLLYEGGVREEAGRWEAGGVRTEGERDGIAALADEVCFCSSLVLTALVLNLTSLGANNRFSLNSPPSSTLRQTPLINLVLALGCEISPRRANLVKDQLLLTYRLRSKKRKSSEPARRREARPGEESESRGVGGTAV